MDQPTPVQLINSQANMGYVASTPEVSDVVTHPALCPGCSRFVIPYEKHKYGGFAAISSIGLCFVTPLLALLPCCCNTFKDIIYTCPNCRTRLSHYKKILL